MSQSQPPVSEADLQLRFIRPARGNTAEVRVFKHKDGRTMVARGDFWWCPSCSPEDFALRFNRGFHEVESAQ